MSGKVQLIAKPGCGRGLAMLASDRLRQSWAVRPDGAWKPRPVFGIHPALDHFDKTENKPINLRKRVLLVLAISMAGYSQAQRSSARDKLQVRQAVVEMFDALSKRDSVSLKAHCTPDISLYEYGEVWNLDSLIGKAITRNTADDFKRTNNFEFISTETDKNMAWVSYLLNSAITRNGKQTTIQWLETVFLERQGKDWKVKHLHSTLIKRD